MALKVRDRSSADVLVGKVSITALGVAVVRVCLMSFRDSWRRARRATAMLPWEGWDRIRAMPVPCVFVRLRDHRRGVIV